VLRTPPRLPAPQGKSKNRRHLRHLKPQSRQLRILPRQRLRPGTRQKHLALSPGLDTTGSTCAPTMASVQKLPLVGQTQGPEDNILIAASIVVDRTGSQDRASEPSLDLKVAASITTASRAGVRRGGRTSTGAVKNMPSTITAHRAGARGRSLASTGAVKNMPSAITAHRAGARGRSLASTGAVKNTPSTLTTGKAGAKGGSLNSTGAVKNTPSTIAAGKAGAKGLGHISKGAVKNTPSTITTSRAGAKGGSRTSTGAVKVVSINARVAQVEAHRIT